MTLLLGGPGVAHLTERGGQDKLHASSKLASWSQSKHLFQIPKLT